MVHCTSRRDAYVGPRPGLRGPYLFGNSGVMYYDPASDVYVDACTGLRLTYREASAAYGHLRTYLGNNERDS